MDINKIISDIEIEEKRLYQQAEQEKAMVEVLPVRFEKNMEAFKKYIPDIYNQFVAYTPSRAFRFFCNENGIPNLLWLDDNVALYGDDPFFECKRQIDDVLNSGSSVQCFEFVKENNPLEFLHVDFMNAMLDKQKSASEALQAISKAGDVIPLMIMFGVGLGYQISYIYEQCQPEVFFIVEPDLDLFYASIFTFDWYELFEYISSENLGLHIFLGQNDDEIIQDLSIAMVKRGSFLSSASIGFWHYPSEKISGLMIRTKQEFFLLASGWGFFDDNMIALSHCVANIRKNLPFLVTGKTIDDYWKNIPVFIIGNGPSLDLALETLDKYKDNAIILSCGSALSALYKANIKPDIHVQVERTKIVPDSHRLLNDDAFLKDILFLSLDVIHPDCAEQFNHVGLAFKPFESGGFLLQKNYPVAKLRDTLRGGNPLVGNTGIAIACRLGFNTIYLFGIDNGYKNDGHHHSKLSFYFDEKGNAKEKLSSLIINRKKHFALGNFGGQVETTSMMVNSRKVIESQLKFYNHVNAYNCSDGAMIQGAIPTRIDDIVISDNKVIKRTLIEHIINDVYSPMNIDVDTLSDKLNTDFFDGLINEIISDWSVSFSSRKEILSCMTRQFDYLSLVAQSSNHHIYRFLIGSVNYSFSVILSTLYRFEQNEDLFLYINKMISVMINYFVSMKDRYKNALSSVDYKEPGLFGN